MLAAMAALILTAAGYAALCAIRPFGHCRKCRGTGIRERRTLILHRRSITTCRRCHGKRYRLRVGRRLHNHSRRIHQNGTR